MFLYITCVIAFFPLGEISRKGEREKWYKLYTESIVPHEDYVLQGPLGATPLPPELLPLPFGYAL